MAHKNMPHREIWCCGKELLWEKNEVACPACRRTYNWNGSEWVEKRRR